MNAIVSEKGQVTIPKKLREQLGLEPGVILDFEEKDGMLVARKNSSNGKEDPRLKWVGSCKLPIGNSTMEYIDAIRGR